MKKNTVPVFEKPVIIRPKSTSDLRLLWQKELKRHETGQHVEQPQLRIEQDLETVPVRSDIQDDKEFELWMDNIQNDLENASLEKYMSSPFVSVADNRTYRAVLQARLHSCNMILSQTSTLLNTLNNLKLGFTAVADQTSSFQTQCNTLVEEEEQLSRYADKLAENLHPFESLEPVSRQLNAPGADFVTKPDFTESLKRVDQGLAFFKQNVLHFSVLVDISRISRMQSYMRCDFDNV